ncbi:14132_t:CDS:10, partial [Dentiscutata erythropus]
SERPTPITFFEKFDFSSKKEGVSNWYSALSESLKIYKKDPKLTEIKQNYEKGYYKQSINDYFRQSERARTLEEEKTSIDKTLTNKTGNAIRKRIHDLLPEETGDQKFSKKPCLRESNQKINQENNDFCLASSDPDLEYFNAQELLDKKGIDLSNAGKARPLCTNHNLESPSSLPSVANNLALEYSSMINSFTLLNDIQDAWCNNFSKITGLTDRDKDKFCQTQIIFRNFSKIVNTNNEDTFVHETLHDLLKEIFRRTAKVLFPKIDAPTVRTRKITGEKPDFKVVTNTKEEILFGEVKTKDSRSLLINKDLIKLSNFQSGALDELIKKYGNKIGLASFGIWVSGPRIRIYEMDLNYDGMYRMFLMANVVTSMERAQFLSLIPVLEALYNIKDRISEVLEEPSPTKDISPLIKSHSDEEKVSTLSTPESLDPKTVKKLWDRDQNKSQDKTSQSHKKNGTENIAQVIADGIQNNIISDSVTEISATAHRQNSDTISLLDLAQLFDKATNAEYYAMKANQDETLCWINYGSEFVVQYNDLVKNSKGKIGEKKAKGIIYDKILEHLIIIREKRSKEMGIQLPEILRR